MRREFWQPVSTTEKVEIGFGLAVSVGIKQTTGLDQIEGIELLKRFPGFRSFYQESLVPAILKGKVIIVFNGPSGAGKETLEAMAGKASEEDMVLLRKETKNRINKKDKLKKEKQIGLEEGTRSRRRWLYYSSLADAFDAGKRTRVVDALTNEHLGFLIDPQREHGYYVPEEFNRGFSILQSRILRARREFTPPTEFLLEFPGFPPDEFPPFINVGWRLIEALASFDNTYFIFVSPEPEVQRNASVFREAIDRLAKLQGLTPDMVRDVLQKFHVKVSNKKIEEIANNPDKFRVKMGNAKAVELNIELWDKWLYYLHETGVYKECEIDVLGGFRPKNFEDLQVEFREYPDFRVQSIERAARYSYSERLGLSKDRFLVGTNELFKDKKTGKELDVDFYREWVEEHSLYIPSPDKKIKDREKYLYFGQELVVTTP